MKTKTRKSKVLSAILSVVMGVSMLPQVAITSFAAAGDVLSVGNGRNQHKGVSDNFSYEVWIDTTGGTGTMTLGKGATFKAEWSASVPSGNFLARRGLDFGSTKRATDYDYIGLDYEADYRQTGSNSGNSRLCVYGWFQNKGVGGNVPLVEYYIIEDWVDWCPSSNNSKTVTIDGAQYKIFQLDHTGPTINGTTETFKQYFSVRQDKRKSGHITVSDHFKAWADQGWGIGNLYEVALNAEGWQSSGVADVTMLNVYTDPSQAGQDYVPPATEAPADPDANGYYFHSTFESGMDNWESRGGTSLAASGSTSAAGSKSLAVEGRTDTWNGAAYPLDLSTFKPGNSYSFSTMVMQNASSSDDFKLSLQYVVDGEEKYDTVAEATGAKGEWVQLSNSSYTIPAGASSLLLYVETADSTIDFFMDEAIGAVDGTKIAPSSGTPGTPSTPDPTEPGNTNPGVPSENTYYFHAPFENGTNSWTARGDSSVAASNTAAHAGSKSLYVTDRTESWHGAGYTLSTNAYKPGTAYSFSVMAMQNEIASDDFKLSLQYTDASGEAQYATIAEAVGAKGEWVKLANTGFTIPNGASDLLLYVETADSTTSFYMDEAVAAPRGTLISASGLAGDVNSDGSVSVLDIVALHRWNLGHKVSIAAGPADMDGNGVINGFDLARLKRYLMNPPDAYVEPPTEAPTTKPSTPVTPGAVDISWIDTSKPMVALTFDDGPVGTASSATSIRIQDALTKNGFHATFFYWGSRINGSNEAEIARAHELGFEVGNHTMNHKDLSTLSAYDVQKEINDCKSILSRITGKDNFLVRPPYLSVNGTVQSNAGAPLINCALDSGDWNNASAQQMIDKIKAGVNNGSLDNSIVLMHETYTSTAEAVEYLLPYLKQQGWQVVTVSEMFAANGQQMKDGQVYTKVY